jgi:hypothetical protein
LLNNKYKMSAGSISLESSIRTCKVNPEEANRIESDRFFNPHNMVCPMWQGVDSTGRPVCPDSFYTKRAGCNSAEDRVAVENAVSRPSYFEYITLSANGVKSGGLSDNTNYQDSLNRTNELREIDNNNPNFGQQYGSNIINGCGIKRYQQAMNSEHSRQSQAVAHGMKSNHMKNNSGFSGPHNNN